MDIPSFSSGLKNYYRANIRSGKGEGDSSTQVMTVSLDAFAIDYPVSLIKIDAEGHEKYVVAGMQQLIFKLRPTLIIETDSKEITAQLSALGYKAERLPGSPNILYTQEIASD